MNEDIEVKDVPENNKFSCTINATSFNTVFAILASRIQDKDPKVWFLNYFLIEEYIEGHFSGELSMVKRETLNEKEGTTI